MASSPAGPAARKAIAAWLVPGLGHFLLGRRARGLLFAVLVLGSATIGYLLEGKLCWFTAGEPLTNLCTLAAMGVGLPYFLLRFYFHHRGEVLAVGFEYGFAFLLTAGLMNLLLVLDAWDIARGRKD